MIKFNFKIKHYVPYRYRFSEFDRDEHGINGEPVSVSGEKTEKLFKSWFNIMKNKNRLIHGTVEVIETGKKYAWNPREGWIHSLF